MRRYRFIHVLLIIGVMGLLSPWASKPAKSQHPNPTSAAATTTNQPEFDLYGLSPGPIKFIKRYNNVLYAVSQNQVQAFDLSDPLAPLLIGSLTLLSEMVLTDAALVDHYLVIGWKNTFDLANRRGGIEVIDIAQPRVMQRVNYLQVPMMMPEAITSHNGWVFIRSFDVDEYLYVILLSDLVTAAALPTLMPIGDTHIGVVDDYIYDRNGRMVDIHQFINPYSTTLVLSYETSMLPKLDNQYTQLGDFSYHTGTIGSNLALQVMDISNPNDPLLIGVKSFPEGLDYDRKFPLLRNDTFVFFVTPQRIYVFDPASATPTEPIHTWQLANVTSSTVTEDQFIAMVDSTLYSFDLDTLAAPATTVMLRSVFSTNYYQAKPLMYDSYLVVLLPNQPMMNVWDLRHPTSPQIISQIPIAYPEAMIRVANTIHVVHLKPVGQTVEQWYSVVDMSDPANPQITKQWSIATVTFDPLIDIGTANTAYIDMTFSNDTVYVGFATHFGWAASNGGLHVVDVSNPSQPTPVKTLLNRFVRGMIVSGSWLFVVHRNSYGSDTLYAWDINDNFKEYESPVILGGYDIGVSRMYLFGSTLAIAKDNVIFRIDVSNPRLPRFIKATSGLGYFTGDGRYLYSFNFINPIISVYDPSQPEVLPLVKTMQGHVIGQILATPNSLVVVGEGLALFRPSEDKHGLLSDIDGTPIIGSSVLLNQSLADVTGFKGSYRLQGLTDQQRLAPQASATIEPQLRDYTFWPAERTVDLSQPWTAQNFIMLGETVSQTLQPEQTTVLTYTSLNYATTVITVPAGTVSNTTIMTFTPRLEPHATHSAFAWQAFDLSLSESEALQQPLEIVVGYTHRDIQTISNESALDLWQWTENGWESVTTRCGAPRVVNPSANTLSTHVCGTGRYALFGPSNLLRAPVVRR